MMHSLSAVLLLTSTLGLGAAPEPESALFCPLAVEPSPGLAQSAEALQKRFLSVARDKSGYALLLRKEVEDVLVASKLTDFAVSDASLSKLAVEGKVQNAGFVSLRLTDRNELLLEGRVVGADGKRLKASVLVVPRARRPCSTCWPPPPSASSSSSTRRLPWPSSSPRPSSAPKRRPKSRWW